jgi:hypothetical protein
VDAVRALVRSDLRRRWRSLVALTLLAGFPVVVALAAVGHALAAAPARRATSLVAFRALRAE